MGECHYSGVLDIIREIAECRESWPRDLCYILIGGLVLRRGSVYGFLDEAAGKSKVILRLVYFSRATNRGSHERKQYLVYGVRDMHGRFDRRKVGFQ